MILLVAVFLDQNCGERSNMEGASTILHTNIVNWVMERHLEKLWSNEGAVLSWTI